MRLELAEVLGVVYDVGDRVSDRVHDGSSPSWSVKRLRSAIAEVLQRVEGEKAEPRPPADRELLERYDATIFGDAFDEIFPEDPKGGRPFYCGELRLVRLEDGRASLQTGDGQAVTVPLRDLLRFSVELVLAELVARLEADRR